ncbi:chromosome partitioning protein ParA [Vibrio parahaemolyticus]|nr:chromosome partitioning protein ParA [Vibrio parahaemolyticus]
MSQLKHKNYRVELIDFDKQCSSHDWAKVVIPGSSQSYNPSLRSLSNIAMTLNVRRDTDFVIMDSPSNFTKDDMTRYTYFTNAILLPMSPSPVDLHASLPFIKEIMDSGLLHARHIALSFIINRCLEQDRRVERTLKLLQHFRQYPTLGIMGEDEQYQDTFFYQRLLPESVDQHVWQQVLKWLRDL